MGEAVAHKDLYFCIPVSVVRVSGAVETSLVLGSVKLMEMDTTKPLTLTGTDLTDTVSTPLWRWEQKHRQIITKGAEMIFF